MKIFFFFKFFLSYILQSISHHPSPITHPAFNIQHSQERFFQQSLNRQKVLIIFCNIHSTISNLTANELCDDSHIIINYDVRGSSSFFNKLIPHKYCLDDYANIKSCYWIQIYSITSTSTSTTVIICSKIQIMEEDVV